MEGTGVGSVEIYTLGGRLVRKLTGSNLVVWDGRNEEGESVTIGIYIYAITDGDGKRTTGKIAVLR